MPPAANMPSDVANGRSVARLVSENGDSRLSLPVHTGSMPFSLPSELVPAADRLE